MLRRSHGLPFAAGAGMIRNAKELMSLSTTKPTAAATFRARLMRWAAMAGGIAVALTVLELVPGSVARENCVLPLALTGRVLHVAAPDPSNILLRDKLSFLVNKDIRLVEDREAAVRQSDIVVAATTSEKPVVNGAWLRPGTFVASVGAYDTTMREVDSETVKRASKLVIDSRADCLHDAGDFMQPVAEGIIKQDEVAEIAEVVSGARPPRTSDDEITYYKSIGVPIQDLVTAQHMARRAAERGIGTEIEIGGD